MLIRDLVYQIINREREKQTSRYSGPEEPTFDDLNTLGNWIIYIERYLQNAKDKFFADQIGEKTISEYSIVVMEEDNTLRKYRDDPGAMHDLHRRAVLREVMKVAALCVAALEHLGEPDDFGLQVDK
jgi:hypothetical protein